MNPKDGNILQNNARHIIFITPRYRNLIRNSYYTQFMRTNKLSLNGRTFDIEVTKEVDSANISQNFVVNFNPAVASLDTYYRSIHEKLV